MLVIVWISGCVVNDDIVIRLRQEWAECQTCAAGNEAADEIERLQAKCKQWERVAEIYYDLHDAESGRYARENCTCYGCEAYAMQTKKGKTQHG